MTDKLHIDDESIVSEELNTRCIHIIILLVPVILASTSAFGQVPDALLSDEASISELSEEQLERYEDPIDLNTCTKEEVDALPLLSAFQKASLWEYLNRQRPLQSIYELQYILGFGLADAQQLASISKLSQPAPHKHIARTKQEVYYATGLSNSTGYSSQTKSFADTKQLIKYRVDHSAASAGVTAENDAGESFRMDNSQLGADYVSAYASFQSDGLSVIAGDYELRWGQGLAIWQGFAMGRGAAADISRVSKPAVPHRSTEENRFMRGGAVTQRWGIAQLTAAASSQLRDGSIAGDSTFTQTYTGLHRTVGESSRRDQLRLNTFAARIHTESVHLHTSVQVISHTWETAGGQELQTEASTGRNDLASADFKAGGDGMLAFGEIAADAQLNTAAIAGIQANPAPGAELCLAARNYSPNYASIDASGAGEYSGTQNERGLYAGASMYPWENLKMSGYFDLFATPRRRYRQSYPASGHEYMLSAQYSLSQSALLTLRHSQQTKALDLPTSDTSSATRQMPDSHRGNYSVRLSMAEGELPLSAGIYRCEYRHSATHEAGHLIFVELHPQVGRFVRIAYQIAVFNTSYNTRIYVYEPHLPQSISVPAHIGTGMKNALRADVRLDRVQLTLKYAYLHATSLYRSDPQETSKHELWLSCIVKIRSQ